MRLYSGRDRVKTLEWSKDDQFLAIADGKIIVIIELASGHVIEHLTGHKSWINELLYLPDNKTLISGSADRTVRLWDLESKNVGRILTECNGIIISLALAPDKNILSIASHQNEIVHYNLKERGEVERFIYDHIRDSQFSLSRSKNHFAIASDDKILINHEALSDNVEIEIHAHTNIINGMTFSPDGRFLISKSLDGTVKFWETEEWQCILTIKETSADIIPVNIEFSFDGEYLVTRSHKDTALRIWKIDLNQLLLNKKRVKQVRYTTAKIVLVGDSGVGKTGLGWRISQGHFKEHESTHGQQFWVVDDLALTRTDGTECEAVLWDLAGQPDYRLVHSLFLDKVDLALILFDPTIRENPLSSAIFWLNQLQMNRESQCPAILVGSRVDRGTSTLTQSELSDFAKNKGFTGGYLPTSASTNEGLDDLMTKIRSLIPWNSFSMTITTVTFKIIKEYILALKENTSQQSVLVTYEDLERAILKAKPEMMFEQDEFVSAVRHLENHGYVSVIQNSRREDFILLFPDLIINLASSVILEARKNPKGLGVLEENRLLDDKYAFPELDALSVTERKIIIDATVSLFLKKAICFRENFNGSNFFVFPSLINEKKPSKPQESVIEGASYIVRGAIENVYPSLVVLLGYTNTFIRHNQWQNQAEYQIADNEVCGFIQRNDKEAEVEFTLYHIDDIPSHTKQLFQSLFERFLIRRNITIKRYLPVVCQKCQEQIQRPVVIDRVNKDKKSTFCHECGTEISLKNALENLTLQEFDEKVDDQKRIADRRTLFETSLIKLKSLLKTENNINSPKCFICYAWGNKEHEAWVLRFAKDLKSAGVNVLLDRWNNLPGSSISQYVDEIMSSDFVIPVGSKLLSKKYEFTTLDSVVKQEQLLINTRLRRKSVHGNTVIPVLIEGTQAESFTPFLQDVVYVDFTREESYFVDLMKLIGQLYGLSDNDDFIRITINLEADYIFDI
ncbi:MULTISPECIES: TIR domain-containing protein [unclassified Pedobacter]|uniref:TIR domain-containing protein n=1 Tax=unclassified Pedobacter TaxID=2628915 RepID=UPI001D35EBEA|nr:MULTISPECIES: TIR domain-containing protein [unclassified Pedobacter]CAH0140606.1 hypothetical protein SRABI36_00535 [Pedobacter sp. Bi36]CAH0196330.1 hypothetical protein SRABI126_01629 [Pedobacter sp. Bi126]